MGISPMLAKIRDRASQRRAGFNIEPQSDVIDPLASQAASDAMQAPNISGESPVMAVAARAVGGGGRGGSPFRTASMTEEDAPEISEAGCPGGVCPAPGSMSSPGGIPGLPPGAVVISERTVGGPQQMGAMQAGVTPVGGVPAERPLFYPSKELNELAANYAALKERGPAAAAAYYRDMALALSRAAEQATASGRPITETTRMAQEAAYWNQEAGKLAQVEFAQQLTAGKQAVAEDIAKAEKRAIDHNIQMGIRATPEGREKTMRNIVGNADDPIGRTDARPEVRVSTYLQDIRRSELKDGTMPPNWAEMDKAREQQLLRYAYASDISAVVGQYEAAGRLPFHLGDPGKEQQMRRNQAGKMAMRFYGKMTPEEMEDAMLFELQPAIETRLIANETNALRAKSGNPDAQLAPERIAELVTAATGHVDALYSEITAAQRNAALSNSPAVAPKPQAPNPAAAWTGPQSPPQEPAKRTSVLSPLLSMPAPTLQ